MWIWIVVILMSYESPDMMYLTNPPRPALVYYDTVKIFETKEALEKFLERYTDDNPLFSICENVPPEGKIKAIYKAKKVEFEKIYEEKTKTENVEKHDKRLRKFKILDGGSQ